MGTLIVRVTAPHAVFKMHSAGAFQGTLPVMPPSTAYGLVMNMAGINIRGEPTPVRKADAGYFSTLSIDKAKCPKVSIAVGLFSVPERGVILYHAHRYLSVLNKPDVERLGKYKPYGRKNAITPTKQQFLVNYDGAIGIRAPENLIEKIMDTMLGRKAHGGVLFAGSSDYLIESIQATDKPAAWYSILTKSELHKRLEKSEIPPGLIRLPVSIDRDNCTKTLSMMFAPVETYTNNPPESSWVNPYNEG
jgi:CRISPR-associated protein Cas5t